DVCSSDLCVAGNVAGGPTGGPCLPAVAGRRGQPAQPGRDPALGGPFRRRGDPAAGRLGTGPVRRRCPGCRRRGGGGSHGAPAGHAAGDGSPARGGFHPCRDRGGGRRGPVRRRTAGAPGLRPGRGGRGHGPRAGGALRPAAVDPGDRGGREPQRGGGDGSAAGCMGSRALTRVPPSGGVVIPTSPPSWLARSRMVTSPRPLRCSGGSPRPLSETSSTSNPSVHAS